MIFTRAAFFLAAIVLLSGRVSARDWPEPGGGPANQGSTVSVAAPRSAPAEKWRVSYDDVLGEPVVSEGTVYAVVRRKGSYRLIAVDARSGRQTSWAPVDAVGFAHVSALGRTLVVVTQSAMHVFVTSEKGLALARSVPGAYRSPATLVPGIAAVFDRGSVRLIDVRTGESLYASEALAAKPVATLGADDSATIYFHKPASLEEKVMTVAVRVDGVQTASPRVSDSVFSEQFVPYSEARQSPRLVLFSQGEEAPTFVVAGPYSVRTFADRTAPFFFVPAQTDEPLVHADPIVWNGALYGRDNDFAVLLQEPTGKNRAVFSEQKRGAGAVDGPATCAGGVLLLGNYAVDLETSRLLWTLPNLEIDGPMIPAADGVVVLHDGAGSLVALSDDPAVVASAAKEKEAERLAAAERERRKAANAAKRARKRGAAQGKKTATADGGGKPARGGRSEKATSASQEPPKRGQFQSGQKDGEPRRKVQPAKAQPKSAQSKVAQGRASRPKFTQPKKSTEPKSAPKSDPPAKPKLRDDTPQFTPTMPGAGSAVVLNDGTRIPGAVERTAGGGVRVTTRGGRAFDVAARKLAAIESDGGVEVVGEAYGLVLATHAALERAILDELTTVAELYASSGLDSEARRLLLELRKRGLADARVEEIASVLALSRDERRASNLPDEIGARKGVLRRLIDVAGWLSDASLDLEASAILAEAEHIWPFGFLPEDANEWIRSAAEPLVPAEFPWAGRSSATERWLAWAPHLAPAGAWFARKDEAPALGPSGSVWTRRSHVLRTRNLVLVTRTSDPLDVGPVLSRGEATVRALDALLSNPPVGDESPLELRLHRSREEYYEEDFKGGLGLDPQSAGTYLESQRSARFYVPEAGRLVNSGRALSDVVAMVVVRQYIAERWRGAADFGLPPVQTPAYWLESGFARFIADQLIDLGQGTWTIDDTTARSLDAARALAARGHLIDFEAFLELSRAAYERLGDRARTTVPVGETRLPVPLSDQGVFDEQAAALVYFLLHESGAETPARFTRLFRERFRDGTPDGAWQELGFETPGALQSAFEAFLDGLKPRE